MFVSTGWRWKNKRSLELIFFPILFLNRYAMIASQNYQELVQSIDPQATSAMMGMMAFDKALGGGLQEARTFLTQSVTQIVQNSSGVVEQGRLKLLPLYVFGLLKSALLKPDSNISIDKRMGAWCRYYNRLLVIS